MSLAGMDADKAMRAASQQSGYAQNEHGFVQLQLAKECAGLKQRIDALKAYCRSCLDAGDWHGVRDAAVDIEVVQARIDQASKST